MSKKPRGHPVLMVQQHIRRNPRHKRVVKDEFLTCADPSGCTNIVSIVGKPTGYSGPVYCVLHRTSK